MSCKIHPTAIVEPGAELGTQVEIGPYAIVGPKVKLGDGSSVGAHAVVSGRSQFGAMTRIFPHAALGFVPQDLKYDGEDTLLDAGDRNTFREFCTAHLGTVQGGGVTRIGSDNLVMAYAHIAHDCVVGDQNVMANGATLAGHVTIANQVILGGLSAVHQFIHVGSNAFLSGGAMVVMDVPPYCTVHGDRAALVGLNTIGLKRSGFDEVSLKAVKRAYRTLFRSKLGQQEAVETARAEAGGNAKALVLIDFVERSERGVTR